MLTHVAFGLLAGCRWNGRSGVSGAGEAGRRELAVARQQPAVVRSARSCDRPVVTTHGRRDSASWTAFRTFAAEGAGPLVRRQSDRRPATSRARKRPPQAVALSARNPGKDRMLCQRPALPALQGRSAPPPSGPWDGRQVCCSGIAAAWPRFRRRVPAWTGRARVLPSARSGGRRKSSQRARRTGTRAR